MFISMILFALLGVLNCIFSTHFPTIHSLDLDCLRKVQYFKFCFSWQDYNFWESILKDFSRSFSIRYGFFYLLYTHCCTNKLYMLLYQFRYYTLVGLRFLLSIHFSQKKPTPLFLCFIVVCGKRFSFFLLAAQYLVDGRSTDNPQHFAQQVDFEVYRLHFSSPLPDTAVNFDKKSIN